MVVAEIGCFRGETAQGWLPIVQGNHGVAILVDSFLGQPGLPSTDVTSSASYQTETVMSTLFSIVRQYTDFELIRGDTAVQSDRIPDHSIDIIFIDGDHRYEGVMRDLIAWTPKLRLGGIICGHDYDNPNVYRAVNEKFKKVRVLGDNVWVADDAFPP